MQLCLAIPSAWLSVVPRTAVQLCERKGHIGNVFCDETLCEGELLREADDINGRCKMLH